MGQILSQPVTEKHSENGGDGFVSYGLSSMQGWRINMEDAHATILDLMDDDYKETKGTDKDSQKKTSSRPESSGSGEQVAFFGVYDGHGGDKAAIFTGEHLHKIIKSTEAFQKGNLIDALKEGFLSCDQAILRDADMRDDDSGCAATSVLITPQSIYCGNAGDSRTIMSSNGFAKPLSYDHKPSNEGEKTRIYSAGGYVDMGRVNGNLALSRGIGDFEFKKNMDLPAEEQIVTCYPDVIQHQIDYSSDEFIVLACDGIWDCLTSQKCVECIRRGIYEHKSLIKICEEIMELCCAPTSDGSGIGCDNMSIIIVALLDKAKNETLDQWYEKIIKRIEACESDESSQYGPISQPYSEIYKNMYGDIYEIGQQSQSNNSRNGSNYSMFDGLPGVRGGYNGNDEDSDDSNQHDDSRDNSAAGAISLQKLLASNAITNENGVIYLDTSSAQSLLAHFGMTGEGENDDGDDDFDTTHKRFEEAESDSEDAAENDKPVSSQKT